MRPKNAECWTVEQELHDLRVITLNQRDSMNKMAELAMHISGELKELVDDDGMVPYQILNAICDATDIVKEYTLGKSSIGA